MKLKADYVEGINDTFDCLIIGGYFGEGKVRLGVHIKFVVYLTLIPIEY